MLTKTLITSRDPKGTHAVRLFEAAYDKLKLEENQAQMLNERGGEFQHEIKKIIQKLIEPIPKYSYPENYMPKPIEEQIEILGKIFGADTEYALKYADRLPLLPENAEAYFAILSPLMVERNEKMFGFEKAYYELTNYVLNKLKIPTLRLQNDKIHIHSATDKAIKKIFNKQNNDIIIIAAQLGLRHQGLSVKEARKKFKSNEYGLWSSAVGCILLTHPERLVDRYSLRIDCAGEFIHSFYLGVPNYEFDFDQTQYGYGDIIESDPIYGSATGFLF